MTEHFKVPEDKVPSRGKILEVMYKVYTERSAQFPKMYPDTSEARDAWLEDMYDTFHEHVRAKVGEPLDTVEYRSEIPDYGDLMSVEEWRANIECGGFIDYDGFGHPARADRIEWKDGLDPTKFPKIEIKMAQDVFLPPSRQHLVPKDATHIVWFNR